MVANAICRALMTGLGLGAVFWMICTLRQGDVFSCAMGVVLLLSGSASFVTFTLAGTPAVKRAEAVQDWIVALSFGVLVAVNGLDLLAG